MSKIRTYEDLLQHEQNLLQQLKTKEVVIRQNLAGMEENFAPAMRALNFIHNAFTRDNRVPFFNIGLELGIDLLLRRFILVRAGWFTKSIIPYLVKNYSSHIFAEEKRKVLVKKVRDVFAKIRPKSKSSFPPGNPNSN